MGKLAALLEVYAWTLAVVVSSWLCEAVFPTPWWGYTSKTIMIAMALLLIAARKRFDEYGLSSRGLRFSVKWGLALSASFALPVFTVVAFALLAGPGGARPAGLIALIRRLVWFLVFTGFAEEVFFRGYVQSRLNEVFGKPYRRLLFPSWRLEYGPGLLITATAVFAPVHIANWVNPFIGKYEIGPHLITLGFLLPAFGGLVLGAVREKTGDIWACSILHGMLNFTTFTAFTVAGPSVAGTAVTVGWLIFFSKPFEEFLSAEAPRSETLKGL